MMATTAAAAVAAAAAAAAAATAGTNFFVLACSSWTMFLWGSWCDLGSVGPLLPGSRSVWKLLTTRWAPRCGS